MKKLLILLSLLVIALFVVSCAPKEGAEGGEEVSEESALAGQAYTSRACTDSDATTTYDTNQLLTKSSITWKKKPYTDYCNPKATPDYIYEYVCKKGKITTWGFNCKTLGENYECKDGACVKTCTPAPVESSKCVIKVFPNYNNNAHIASIKEYQYANCSTYFGNNNGLNNNNNFSVCGWNYDQTKLTGLCQDNKGCCTDEIPLSANYCDGNIQTNTSKNACTGEEKVNQLDCSTWVNIDGTPKICMQDSKGGFFCGVTSCTLGEKIVTCNNYKEYQEYTCLGAQFDKSLINPTWVPGSDKSNCPPNKTCQFFSGKTYGICK